MISSAGLTNHASMFKKEENQKLTYLCLASLCVQHIKREQNMILISYYSFTACCQLGVQVELETYLEVIENMGFWSISVHCTIM